MLNAETGKGKSGISGISGIWPAAGAASWDESKDRTPGDAGKRGATRRSVGFGIAILSSGLWSRPFVSALRGKISAIGGC